MQIPENTALISKTNLNGNIIEVNDEMIKISGFSKEELIGNSHKIMRHPDMPSGLFKEMWKTILYDEPWNGVIKNRTKSGDFYWAYATVTPYFNQEGKAIGYISVRRKASEAQIRIAEELYKSPRYGKLNLSLNPIKSCINFK